jgi:beta-lactamase regulating signal transducer with metallopeptidase domain
MISDLLIVLVQSALRALVLAVAVWAGLRVFRVRNVLAAKLAWSMVLAAALVMPALLPLAARLPVAVVPLPRLAAIDAPPAQQQAFTRLPVDTSAPVAPHSIEQSQSRPASLARAAQAAVDAVVPAAVPDVVPDVAPSAVSNTRADTSIGMTGAAFLARCVQAVVSISPVRLAGLLYLCVAGVLLLRLLFGLAVALRLWFRAQPVSLPNAIGAGKLLLRASAAVASPVTLGSGVILPADYATWDEQKLRIVLAHERSHIRQKDFYLQLLAGLYAALVWISPLGWWLKRKLSDLGEAIGDRCGAEEATSRTTYVQVLLEFAAAPRLNLTQITVIGVAMARPSSLSRRMEFLLNESAFRQAFSTRRRAFAAALVLPVVLFAGAALVRVEAATQTPQKTEPASTSASTQPATGQSQPDAVSAPDAVQLPPQNQPDTGTTPNVAPAQSPVLSTQHSPVHVDVPAIHVDVPAIHVDVPAKHIEVPAVHVDVPAHQVNVPAVHVDVPAQHIEVPAQHIDMPEQHIEVPAQHIDVPAIHIDEPPAGAQDNSGGHAWNRPPHELLAMVSGFRHTLIQSNGSATEATFDRTLTASGQVELHVGTGAGNIHLTRGSAGQVHVRATIHSESADDAEEVRNLAANPPIEQTGNIIRIGQQHHEGANHISIDYEIEAPADALLSAASGSGNIKDEGVGHDAKLMTGSGDVTATGIEGGFTAQTGSGNIVVENNGEGDAKVQTGSGSIDVKGVHGALKAQTGSGDIKIAGTPSAEWKLQSGSGNIELSPGGAPMTLDASSASGSITSDSAITAQTSSEDRHRLHGELNGGGPEVRIETGSGDIRIH